MKPIYIVLIVVAAVPLLFNLGLQLKPAAFPSYPEPEGKLETISLPEGLPAPVERFYRELYDAEVPVIKSAVITGKADMRLAGGITFPGRFRFTHIAGQGYRHYIEATFYGIPVFKVNEYYLDGRARLELPFSVIEHEPKVDQAANLGLWAESIWLPSVFITDERVRWEPVDEDTALLVVPFGEQQERFVVRFEPDSGMPHLFTSMRYKDAADQYKTLWISEAKEWGEQDDRKMLTVGALTWLGDRGPWAVFTVEEIVYNVDVTEYIRSRGL